MNPSNSLFDEKIRPKICVFDIARSRLEKYLQETDCDDQSIASSEPGDASENDVLDLNDEYDFGSELGCDGSGPCEEESEHDHMEEEAEHDLLEEESEHDHMEEEAEHDLLEEDGDLL